MGEEHNVVSRIRDADTLLQILDQLPTSVFVKNEKLQFEFSNAAHCELIGVEAEELLGYSDQDFYPAEEAAGFLARDRAVLEGDCTVASEEVATSRSGVTTPYLTRKSRLAAADGKTYLIGTNTNLSEIHKREEQYRALAQTVPVGIWQVDEDGKTSFANPLLLAYLGISDAGDLDIHAALAGGHIAFPGESCRFETDIRGKSGETRRALVISSGWLSLSSQGHRSAIVSVVDISEMTELKRVNEEIVRLNRELADNVHKLKEAQDEILRRGRMAQLGQLTATVAHEIRNPLGAVRTASFLLERKLKDKGLGVEQQLLRISNGITRCDNIITQLLDFSRTRALQAETLVVDDWLGRVVSEEAEKLPSIVTINCRLGLGDIAADIDPNRMSRVIINLLSNASEAMVGKGDEPDKVANPSPKITIATARSPRGIEISVADNGPGIEEAALPRILEPLFTTKNFGTGLGLPAVEKILREHGGGLDIRSDLGRGAVFTAWFPQRQSTVSAA
ncbi:MAG: PAS domain S-box protein [Alphaproteobacteria bacterium]|nr:PAS domain S-box protein [Alphaproteobacteria bacterium]